MRFLNNSVTAVILTALVSLTGCGGSSGSSNNSKPDTTPTPTSSFGVFRNLKSTQANNVAYSNIQTSSNQSVTMSVPRQGHKAIAIGDGRFLLFGGEPAGSTSVFDLFDSATERFTALPIVTSRRREWANLGISYAMLRLPDGKVLISGGTTDWCDYAEIYDPKDQTIYARTISYLYNNTSQMFNIGNGKILMFGLALVDPMAWHYIGNGVLDTNTWDFTLIDTPEKVYGISAVQLDDGSILYAGGITEPRDTVKSIYRIDTTTLVTTKIGELKVARVCHGIALLPDGDVGVYGGITLYGHGSTPDRLASVEVISTKPESLGTTTLKTPLLEPRSATQAIPLQNGYVLNAGGTNETGYVASTEFVHNHILNTSGTTGSLITPRRMYSAIPLNNGRILISGGFGMSADSFNTAEIYDPAHKVIIGYDTATEVTLGATVHFTSEDKNINWSCTSKGSIDSNGVLTTLKPGNVVVTGKASEGEASVTIRVLEPVSE